MTVNKQWTKKGKINQKNHKHRHLFIITGPKYFKYFKSINYVPIEATLKVPSTIQQREIAMTPKTIKRSETLKTEEKATLMNQKRTPRKPLLLLKCPTSLSP